MLLLEQERKKVGGSKSLCAFTGAREEYSWGKQELESFCRSKRGGSKSYKASAGVRREERWGKQELESFCSTKRRGLLGEARARKLLQVQEKRKGGGSES